MKKSISILLIMMLVLSMISGCSEKSTTPTKSTSSSTTGNDTGLIVYTQKTLDQYFHVALQKGLEGAVNKTGFKLEVANCNNDSALQNDQMINFLAKNPKAIISNPVDSDSLIDAIAKAKAQGIPVIGVDNPSSSGEVDCTITFDNEKAGFMAGDEIAKRLIAKYGEAKGRVVNVYGAMSSECWRLRKKGFDDAMKKYPKIEYIAVPGEGNHSKSQDAMTNAIAQYGTVDAVHCPSDAPGLGLVEALKTAGMWKKIGEKGHIIFVTIDGEPSALQNVIDGYYDMSIVEDAMAYGPIAIDLLNKYVFKGNKVPTSGEYINDAFYWKKTQFSKGPTGPYLIVPPYIIDKNNVNDPKHWAMVATGGNLNKEK